MKTRILLGIILWLGCFYFAEANWAGDFCAEYCSDPRLETPAGAVRSGLVPCLVIAPVAAIMYWSMNDSGEVMWDWPKHLNTGLKPFVMPEVKQSSPDELR